MSSSLTGRTLSELLLLLLSLPATFRALLLFTLSSLHPGSQTCGTEGIKPRFYDSQQMALTPQTLNKSAGLQHVVRTTTCSSKPGGGPLDKRTSKANPTDVAVVPPRTSTVCFCSSCVHQESHSEDRTHTNGFVAVTREDTNQTLSTIASLLSH